MAASKSKSWEEVLTKGIKEHVDKHGLSGLEELFKEKLESWKNIEINIGVTGDTGAGKSSFINAIRKLKDNHKDAAEVGVIEKTKEATCYSHPTNNNIFFWDLPGIGSPKYPALEKYCKKIEVEKYDLFLIFSRGRFTENDRLLAEKVKELEKPFFFIRTYIDVDSNNASRIKPFNEQEMLEQIRENCLENLKHSEVRPDNVFLISNHHPEEWDFSRLTKAILNALPYSQRECLTFSLTSQSKEILKEKVDLLRGRIFLVASASAAAAATPLPGLNIAVDVALITKELKFYKSQLGLPDQNSDENQENVFKICALTSAVRIASFFAPYVAASTVEEFARFIPVVGLVIAGGVSFAATYRLLTQCLQEMEHAALDFANKMMSKAVDDLDAD